MRYLTYIFPLVLLFFTACGGGGTDNKQKASESNSQSQTQATADKSNDVRTINIIGIDKMKYVVKEEGEMIGTGKKIEDAQGNSYIQLESIDAKAGNKLHIKLTTKSNLPATSMSHNWILLKMDADPGAFSQAATSATDNDYIPSEKTDQIIAHTDMAAGDETVEVTFTVPEKTGEYPYLCSFPAHFAAGMKGTFNVK